MKNVAHSFARFFGATATALVFIASLALIALGAWMVTPALGLITAGVLAGGSVIAYELQTGPPRPARGGDE